MSDELSREFELGDILSITTGCLLSSRRMEGVYDILNFMTGDNLFTHQLPDAGDKCRPFLLEQHPQLADLMLPKFDNPDAADNWREDHEKIYGKMLVVTPLPSGAHEHRDPLESLIDMMGPERVLVADTDDIEGSAREIADILDARPNQ